MQIQEYGVYIVIKLHAGPTLQKNINSFDDISDIRIEDILRCDLFLNSELVWNYGGFNLAVRGPKRVLAGWSLKYLIKRTFKNIFQLRRMINEQRVPNSNTVA